MRLTMGRMLLAAVVVVGLAAAVAAQPPAGGGRGGGMMGQGGPGMRQGMGPGGPGNAMAALNLTPEQREKVRGIQEKHRAATQEMAERVRGLQEQLRATLFGDNPDEAKGLAGQVAQLEAELMPSRIAMQVEIVKVLTPDQRKIAMELNLFGPVGMGGPNGPGRRGGQEPVRK